MHAWTRFLDLQEKQIGKSVVDKWLRSLQISHFDAGNLYLLAQDSFQIIWFEEQIRHKVKKTLLNNNNRPIQVYLSLEKDPSFSPPTKKKKDVPTPSAPSFSLTFDELNPIYSMDEFFVSKKNQLAYSLLSQLATKETETAPAFNPMYLFGPPGTGKTHLLMATAAHLEKRGWHALYIRAETFTEHVVSAIRASEMERFRRAYRTVDVLLIDDIHVFSRKKATQEEFFHTFNTLHMGNKPIIFSANCTPSALLSIEPRLISRFEWGITLPLALPSQTELYDILKKRAKTLQFRLPANICQFLADTFVHPKNSCRALEALILRAHLKRNLSPNSPLTITLSMAEHYLSDLIEEEQKKALTVESITNALVEHFDVRKEVIFGKGQAQEALIPRQVGVYLCRTLLKMPYTKIGEHFGRDHSTIMASVKRVKQALEEKSPPFFDTVNTLTEKLQA